ncbi:hypothetical protein SM033_00103 [Vibrio phage vB_VpaM_sm033]|nr:hypothetical protein SM033_00103 [Vibrio phage vB_VpaM_sm033]
MKKVSPSTAAAIACVGYIAAVLIAFSFAMKAEASELEFEQKARAIVEHHINAQDDMVHVQLKAVVPLDKKADYDETLAIAYSELCERYCTFNRAEEAKALRQLADGLVLQGEAISIQKSILFENIRKGDWNSYQEIMHDHHMTAFNKYMDKEINVLAEQYTDWLNSLSNESFRLALADLCTNSGTACELYLSRAAAAYKFAPDGIVGNTKQYLIDRSATSAIDRMMIKNLLQDFAMNNVVYEDIAAALLARDYLIYEAAYK